MTYLMNKNMVFMMVNVSKKTVRPMDASWDSDIAWIRNGYCKLQRQLSMTNLDEIPHRKLSFLHILPCTCKNTKKKTRRGVAWHVEKV